MIDINISDTSDQQSFRTFILQKSYCCFYFMAGIFGYFAVAFHIIGSKKQGEENKEEFREVFISSLLIDFVIGVIYGMLTILLCKFIFKNFYGLSGEALNAAVTYSYIT